MTSNRFFRSAILYSGFGLLSFMAVSAFASDPPAPPPPPGSNNSYTPPPPPPPPPYGSNSYTPPAPPPPASNNSRRPPSPNTHARRGYSRSGNSYTPLVPGALHTYSTRHKGRYRRHTLVTKKGYISGGTIYYKIQPHNMGKRLALIGANLPGTGVWVKRAAGVSYVPLYLHAQLQKKNMGNAFPMFDYPLRNGAEKRAKRPKNQLLFTVMGQETVRVPAGTYKTVKVRVLSSWTNGSVYTGYFWLARGVGIVKWQRRTGRIDVLEKVTFPRP